MCLLVCVGCVVRVSVNRGGDGKNEGRQNRMNMRFFALYAVRYLQLSLWHTSKPLK